MWVRDARSIVVICPTAQEKMCTTGNLRMARMLGRFEEFVGWAKRERAHHSSTERMDGGHGALRLCPPYEFPNDWLAGHKPHPQRQSGLLGRIAPRNDDRPLAAVIPGRRVSVEPGIHNHHREYGFRSRALRRIPE
jgi:hypothetical protein